MRELATLVVPVFETSLQPLEQTLLHHAIKQFSDFPLVFVCGDSTQDHAQLKITYPESTTYKFDSLSFTNRSEYTKLLLKPDFYDLFTWSQYLLLFEPVSYIVKNQLHYWCKQGYDYISDETGLLSLRDVDKFLSLSRKGGRSLNKFFGENASNETDRDYWIPKTKGIWPSLRSPTAVVSNYFTRSVDPMLLNLSIDDLPFAITGIDINAPEHKQFLQTLEL